MVILITKKKANLNQVNVLLSSWTEQYFPTLFFDHGIAKIAQAECLVNQKTVALPDELCLQCCLPLLLSNSESIPMTVDSLWKYILLNAEIACVDVHSLKIKRN